MSDAVQPSQENTASDLTGVQWLVAVFDACTADKATSDPDGRRAVMRTVEQLIAGIVPTWETDFFLLAGRLNDHSLSRSTRDAIAVNLAKAAPLMTSRQQRLDSWLSAYTSAVAMLRGFQSDALDRYSKGFEAWQATLSKINADRSEADMKELQRAVEAAVPDTEHAKGLLAFANLMFGDEISDLNRIAADGAEEAKLFAEASCATMH